MLTVCTRPTWSQFRLVKISLNPSWEFGFGYFAGLVAVRAIELGLSSIEPDDSSREVDCGEEISGGFVVTCAMARYSLSLQKKFSIRWRAL